MSDLLTRIYRSRHAAIKRSISSACEFQPKLILMAEPASASSIPMAASTAERCTLPEEQAEPALTQTLARSSAITWDAAETPGIETQVVLGNLLAAEPNTRALGAMARSAASFRSRSAESRPPAASAAAPKP